jgi:hypothetical protein
VTDLQKAAAYAAVGVAFFVFMAVHDIVQGRPVQKRDLHIIAFWPLVAALSLVLGLVVFADLSSKDEGLREPWRWLK